MKPIVLFVFFLIINLTAYSQVGIQYTNQEEADYTTSMKSSNFTYLVWDRNHNGGGLFNDIDRPMFFYWDNDDSELGYLIDTRNMSRLNAAFYKLKIQSSGTIGGKFNPSGSYLTLTDGSVDMLLDNNEIFTNHSLNFGSSYSEPFRFRNVDVNGRQELMIIDSQGNVGIGTTSPGKKLEVAGSVKIDDDLVGQTFTIDLDAGTYQKRITSNQVGGSATMELQTYSNLSSGLQTRILMRGGGSNDIELYDKHQNQFVNFDGDNGRVGIGTTSPSEKLSVNGTIRSKEVKVEAVPWPDYVFSVDYKLSSLEATKGYIKKHGHLPNIPSAEEVAENGIALGEMNAKLLLKIEELTLYIIEQNQKL